MEGVEQTGRNSEGEKKQMSMGTNNVSSMLYPLGPLGIFIFSFSHLK